MDYLTWLLAAGLLAPAPTAVPDTVRGRAAPPLAPIATLAPAAVAPQRPLAFEYSEGYHLRLTIHRAASFATIPLFAAQYFVGRKLYDGSAGEGMRSAHGALALSVAGLFAVNSVTGGWNLWEGRRDPNGRTRRWLHAGLMFVAEAGFVATGATAPDDDEGYAGGSSNRRLHRNLAIASMGTALASYLMMLVWRD